MSERLALFGAPTSRASHTAGQEQAPAVLRRAGIVGLLNARGFDVADLGDLPVMRFAPDRSSPRAHNVDDVVQVVEDVDALVARAARQADTVLVLGGDCTIVLGALAGLERIGRTPALVYLDAHGDLNVPSSVPYGALDWMGLAHALALPGAEPRLVGVGPRTPLITPDRIRLLGTVPHELTEWERETIDRERIEVIDVEAVRADPAGAARRAVDGLADPDHALWLHLDVDAVDSVDLPIADFHQLNAGLPFATLLEAVATVAADERFAGLTVSQFNPDHADREGAAATRFVRGLVEALARGRRHGGRA